MSWSIACRTVPDETPQIHGVQQDADQTEDALEHMGPISSLSTRPPHSFSSGGRCLSSWPLTSLVGPIARFPGCLPLDRPTVGGATPTLLGGVPIGGVCSSAYLLTSDHVRNGDGAERETGRVRRPLLADWPKRNAMPMLNSAHACARSPASMRRMLRAECCCYESEDGRCRGCK